MALLPKQRQNLLFSATFSDDIKKLADKLLNSPELIEVAKRNTASERVEQSIYPVDRNRKRELLVHLIKEGDWQQVLVFTRTKHGANKLTEQLNGDGISAAAIHGNKSQGARTKALADFKSGEVRALIATDVAARGIDIDKLPHVVNFELPNVPEDYVHRIGRTGRAEAEGEAISLVCIDEQEFLRDIEKLIKKEIPKIIIPGFEPDPNAKAQPVQLGNKSARGKPLQKLGEKPKSKSKTTKDPQAPTKSRKRPGKPKILSAGSKPSTKNSMKKPKSGMPKG